MLKWLKTRINRMRPKNAEVRAWEEYQHAYEEYNIVDTALQSQMDNVLAIAKLHLSFLETATTIEELEYYTNFLAPKYEFERAFSNQLEAIADNKYSVLEEKRRAIFDE